jgi:hypothetical protein
MAKQPGARALIELPVAATHGATSRLFQGKRETQPKLQ